MTAREAVALLVHDGWLERRFGSGTYVTQRAAETWAGIFSAFDILQPRTSSFHVRVPDALGRFLENAGLHTELYVGRPSMTDDDPPWHCGRLTADVAAGRLDALVLLSTPHRNSWQQWVANLEIPVVGTHTPYRVDADYPGMVRAAVHRLHAQGCGRIAMLSWAFDELVQPFAEALAELDLPFRPEWVKHDLHPMLSGAGWEEFREVWSAFPEKPDGLLVCDDVLFDEVQVAIQELGIRVPEQLRIVAHANRGAGKRYPFPVTLAECDPVRYAEALGEMLLARLRGHDPDPRRASVPFTITASASTESTEARESMQSNRSNPSNLSISSTASP